MRRVRYGKHIARVEPAAGVTGTLHYDGTNCFFRVQLPNGDFRDYDLRHDDLQVTLAADALASFYYLDDDCILDHSPEVLGLPPA
ncbi:MAG: hypothetical protein LAT63_05130 [Marinobacter sp.]|nr:hypothetical protein [Marinobacter sp.]